MERINNVNLAEQNTLSVFCFDTIEVKARVTFDSCLVGKVKITYWMDDDEDMVERVNKMFDILFEEVARDIKESGAKMVDY